MDQNQILAILNQLDTYPIFFESRETLKEFSIYSNADERPRNHHERSCFAMPDIKPTIVICDDLAVDDPKRIDYAHIFSDFLIPDWADVTPTDLLLGAHPDWKMVGCHIDAASDSPDIGLVCVHQNAANLLDAAHTACINLPSDFEHFVMAFEITSDTNFVVETRATHQAAHVERGNTIDMIDREITVLELYKQLPTMLHHKHPSMDTWRVVTFDYGLEVKQAQ